MLRDEQQHIYGFPKCYSWNRQSAVLHC